MISFLVGFTGIFLDAILGRFLEGKMSGDQKYGIGESVNLELQTRFSDSIFHILRFQIRVYPAT